MGSVQVSVHLSKTRARTVNDVFTHSVTLTQDVTRIGVEVGMVIDISSTEPAEAAQVGARHAPGIIIHKV